MARFFIKSKGVAIILFCAILFSGVAYGDDVTEAINEALQSYKDGKFSDAMGSLNYAAQLIGQKKGSDLKTFLPEPLSGWQADEATSHAMGAVLLGGGVSAERRYRKDSGSVTIQIVTDSPMLQGMMMMLANPAMAGADGAKMERIAGERAMVKYSAQDKSGTVVLVIANRFLINVEGDEVSVGDLKAYAGKIDYQKLAALQ